MRGRWAAGIVPRNFTWVIQDRLAVSERPGGYAPHHRKVRRQEEILWINGQRFSRIVSLLPSSHNLHAYEERNLPSAHFPLPLHGDVAPMLAELYPALLTWLRAGDRLLMHQEELGERMAGVVAGFLCWCGVLPEPPRAISAVEQLFRRQMGAAGRSIVAAAATLPPSTEMATFGHAVVGVRLTAADAPADTDREVVEQPEASRGVEGTRSKREISAPKVDKAPTPPTSETDSRSRTKSSAGGQQSVSSADDEALPARPRRPKRTDGPAANPK